MVSTVKLFDLFYNAGLLEHNSIVDTSKLLRSMIEFESFRFSDSRSFIEYVRTDINSNPVAYISSMPCYGDDIWNMQQHCSIKTGFGLYVLMDVWKTVIENEKIIKWVIGFYNPKNEKTKKLWKLAYDIIDNPNICDFGKYRLKGDDYFYYPINISKIYLDAFKIKNHKIEKKLRLFARPTGNISTKGKIYDSILFKVCDESKEKFKRIWE